MKVADRTGNWVQLAVDNGNFEKSSEKNPLKGLRNAKSIIKKKGIIANVFLDENPEYKKSLHIHSEGAEPDKRVFYGNNISAGKYLKINGLSFITKFMVQENHFYFYMGTEVQLIAFRIKLPILHKNIKLLL